MNPLAVDFYAGLGGWAEGFLSEGFDVVGFDIERHDYGTGGYPGHLVIQDVLTLHGSQFKEARVLVASPPCQKYSYMAMPWKRAKALAAWYLEFPERIAELNALFDACFRIQREACEAAGRHIPLIVENVVGAQPWVGRAGWHFGSYYLWGDIPALMPMTKGIKNNGGSWYAVAHNTTSGEGQNPDGRKLMSESGRRTAPGNGVRFTSRDCGIEGVKQRGSGREWSAGEGKIPRMTSSNSLARARARASAEIAKIPFPLARHIARCFRNAS